MKRFKVVDDREDGEMRPDGKNQQSFDKLLGSLSFGKNVNPLRSMTFSDEICLDRWSLNLSAGCQVEARSRVSNVDAFNIVCRLFRDRCYIKISRLVVPTEAGGRVGIYACRVLQRPVITRVYENEIRVKNKSKNQF